MTPERVLAVSLLAVMSQFDRACGYGRRACVGAVFAGEGEDPGSYLGKRGCKRAATRAVVDPACEGGALVEGSNLIGHRTVL